MGVHFAEEPGMIRNDSEAWVITYNLFWRCPYVSGYVQRSLIGAFLHLAAIHQNTLF